MKELVASRNRSILFLLVAIEAMLLVMFLAPSGTVVAPNYGGSNAFTNIRK